MKFQPKRFVVELKRGTNRADFVSPDAMAHKFSSAEDVLFGRSPKVQPAQAETQPVQAPKAGGRILNSLIETAPVVDEPSEPVRRGRKPGSKNKPKLFAPAAVEATRAPRSSSPQFEPDAARSDGPPSWRDHILPDHLQPEAAAPAASVPPSIGIAAEASGRPRRGRLRDRSRIIRRYVLECEPRPGQPGSLRARKVARRSPP